MRSHTEQFVDNIADSLRQLSNYTSVGDKADAPSGHHTYFVVCIDWINHDVTWFLISSGDGCVWYVYAD